MDLNLHIQIVMLVTKMMIFLPKDFELCVISELDIRSLIV
jgi:hypothetical protein